jgi:hypothetical protein
MSYLRFSHRESDDASPQPLKLKQISPELAEEAEGEDGSVQNASSRSAKKSLHRRSSDGKGPARDDDDLFASDASDEFPSSVVVQQMKIGPPKGKKPLMERVSVVKSVGSPLVPNGILPTEAQRAALRLEEEESTQFQSNSGPSRPPSANNGAVRKRSQSMVEQEEESQITATAPASSRCVPRQPFPNDARKNAADNDHDALRLFYLDSDLEEGSQPQHEPALDDGVSSDADEHDNVSITSQAIPPLASPVNLREASYEPPPRPSSPEPQSPSLKPPTPAPVFRGVPQISPSAFAPHLPTDTSIDNFTSPIKHPASVKQIVVEDWSVEEGPTTPSPVVPTNAPAIDLRARGLELANRYAPPAPPAKRRSVLDIVNRREKASFFPFLAKSQRVMPAAVVRKEVPEEVRALQPTQTSVTPESGQPGLSGPTADEDTAVRQMEERYVDLEGGMKISALQPDGVKAGVPQSQVRSI